MNRILTTSVIDPSIQQPFTTKSLDFLQDITKQATQGLVQTLVGDTFASGTTYVLSGLNPYGTNQYTSGYIFYNSELYVCAGKSSTTAFTGTPVCNISDTADSIADPLIFSDSIPRNVHRNRLITLSDLTSGSGIFNLSAATYVQNNGDWKTVGSDGGITTFNTGWSGSTTSPLQYRKDKEGVVRLRGRATIYAGAYNYIFTLPTGFRHIAGGAAYFPVYNPYTSTVAYAYTELDGSVNMAGTPPVSGNTYHFDSFRFDNN